MRPFNEDFRQALNKPTDVERDRAFDELKSKLGHNLYGVAFNEYFHAGEGGAKGDAIA